MQSWWPIPLPLLDAMLAKQGGSGQHPLVLLKTHYDRIYGLGLTTRDYLAREDRHFPYPLFGPLGTNHGVTAPTINQNALTTGRATSNDVLNIFLQSRLLSGILYKGAASTQLFSAVM